ncbi:hypothetical protein V8D89_008313 [Ganoderma adspersum]
MVRFRWKLHEWRMNWGMWTKVGILSLGLNTFFVVQCILDRPQPSLFSRWSSLHNIPLVDMNAVSDPHPIDGHKNVIATSFFTDEFATAVAAVGASLTRANTTARRVMLYIPEQVSPRGLCIASATGFHPYAVERIAPPGGSEGIFPHFIDQYTKLRLWEVGEMLGAHGVVYLDADTLVLRNFDELFTLPYPFAATGDVYTNHGFVLGFNAGVLFLRPSMAVFREMLRKIPEAEFWRHEAEQAFLNTFFARDVVRLPYAYNANLAIKVRAPKMWAGISKEIRVIHYTMVKPFTKDNKNYALVPMGELEANARRRASEEGGVFVEEMELWAQAWHETYETYGQKLEDCMALSDKPGQHTA